MQGKFVQGPLIVVQLGPVQIIVDNSGVASINVVVVEVVVVGFSVVGAIKTSKRHLAQNALQRERGNFPFAN